MPADIIDVDSIIRSYHENADYDNEDSVPKAKLFRLACRRLLNPAVLEASRQHGPDIVQHNLDVIRRQLDDVEDWLNANDPANTAAYGTTRLNFNYLRG